MSRHEDRLHPVDRVVLAHLSDAGIDYPTCIATHHGVAPTDVRRRCAALADAGLVEPVSPEVVYRITEDGERCLEGLADERADAPTSGL